MTNPENVEKGIKENTKLIWIESIKLNIIKIKI
jgi:O-acetylhomoserine/O-acetylserine sulfhydrylase-like pyridoxal-dependent enzyme